MQQDLTFYVARRAQSDLSNVVTAAPDDWVWTPCWADLLPTEEARQMLSSNGWQPLAIVRDMELPLLVLASQLADMRLLLAPDQPINAGEVWAPTSDLARINALPVLLAFPVPSDKTNQARVQDGRRHLSSNRALPPHAFGQIGLIFSIDENDAPRWTRIALSELDQHSQQRQQRLGAALDRLAVARNLARPAWLAQWREIQQMARQLAADYWNVAHSMQDEAPAPDFSVLQHGMAQSFMNAPLFAIVRGMLDAARGGGQWKEARWTPEEKAKDVKKTPFYTKANKRTGDSTMLSLRAPGATNPEELTASAWEQLRSKPIDLDTYIAFLMHYYNAPDATLTEDGFTTLYFARLADYFGYAKKTTIENGHKRDAGHKEDVIQALDASLERLAWHWVDIAATPKGKRKQEVLQGHLVLTKRRLVQRLMQADGTLKEQAIAVQAKPDAWLHAFDTGGTFRRQMGTYLQQVFSYHNRKEQWEKGLAYYFTFVLRFTAGDGSHTLRRSVADLLQECSLWGDEDYARQHPKDMLRTPFERALQRLVKDRIIASWRYVENPTEDLPRGWLGDWLKQMVEVSIGPLLLEGAPGVTPYQEIIDDVNARADEKRARQKSATPRT